MTHYVKEQGKEQGKRFFLSTQCHESHTFKSHLYGDDIYRFRITQSK